MTTRMITPSLPTSFIQDILSYLGRDIYQDKKNDWYFRFTPGLYDDALGWMFQSITSIVNRRLQHIPGDMEDSVWRFNEIRQIDRPRCCVIVSYYTCNHIDKADYSITFRFLSQYHLPLTIHIIGENTYIF